MRSENLERMFFLAYSVIDAARRGSLMKLVLTETRKLRRVNGQEKGLKWVRSRTLLSSFKAVSFKVHESNRSFLNRAASQGRNLIQPYQHFTS